MKLCNLLIEKCIEDFLITQGQKPTKTNLAKLVSDGAGDK